MRPCPHLEPVGDPLQAYGRFFTQMHRDLNLQRIPLAHQFKILLLNSSFFQRLRNHSFSLFFFTLNPLPSSLSDLQLIH